jgi:fibrillarin-like pre-rRNA processing protein
LLKDARKPDTYSHIVESDLDLLVQDVATRGQASVAVDNARFLAEDGQLLLAIKARSEDVTAAPEAVFDAVCAELTATYKIVDRQRLDPYHDDHLGVVARKR